MNKEIHVILSLGGMLVSGLAMADCPSTMPDQLREDCIVYEGAGAHFPTSDYAHMDLYNDWLNEQKSSAETSAMEIISMEKK